jgi:hypothetical protein
MPRLHCPCCCCLLWLHITGHATAVVAIMQEGKKWPTMPRHCCPHSCPLGSHAPLFAPLLSSPLRQRARDSQQCRHCTIFCSVMVCLCCHHHCCCVSGQRRADNGAKVPSFAQAPLLLCTIISCTIIHAAAIDGVGQACKERPTMPRHHRLHSRHRLCCAQSFTPLPSLPLWE